MRDLYLEIAIKTSKLTTRLFSTSFSLGIWFLNQKFHDAIYAIYGFVRFADEIVDTFHNFDKKMLLQRFRQDTFKAIDEKISMNPILHSFQHYVNLYGIDKELIEAFLHSMEMDLEQKTHNTNSVKEYIYGSAEVVGLMCLRVFCEGDSNRYNQLKENAIKLGSAYQKINFLRDLNTDFFKLGRTYFPDIDIHNFNEQDKQNIISNIEEDFRFGLEGIKMLPPSSGLGVYLSYVYYTNLLKKIKNTPANMLKSSRIRVSNCKKIILTFNGIFQYKIGFI